MNIQPMAHIGTKELISLPEYGINNVPAKVDTGADSSAIWASQITDHDGELSFVLFGPASPHYSGQVIRTRRYSMVNIKNSFGHQENRYRVNLKIRMAGRIIKVRVTLANRSNNRYPVLIGRRTIKGKFLVDVSKHNLPKTTRSLLFLYNDGISSPLEFIKSARQSGLEIVGAKYDDLIFRTGQTNKISISGSGVDLADFAMVYFNRIGRQHRGSTHIAAAIAEYLAARNIDFIDESVILDQDPSKMHQYVVLTDNKIAVPQTIFMYPELLAQNYEMIIKEFGLPFVLKDDLGKRSRHRYFIANKTDFDRALAMAREDAVWLLAQKYIDNDSNYRLLVMGSRVEVVIKRSHNQFKDDNRLGDIELASLQDLPDSVVDAAVAAVRLLHLQVAGVDMMQDKSTKLWYCLEVNKSPQIYSGQYINDKQAGLIRYLKRRLGD